MPKLTQERLKEILHYDSETGIFTWLVSRDGPGCIDGVAGSINSNGYLVIGVDWEIYGAHRLAFLWMEGYLPENDVDHIDRSRSNNRWSNLREVSRLCNLRNSKLNKHNTIGVSGVDWYKDRKKWGAFVTVNGGRKHLGCYEDFEDAVCARLAAEQCLNWSGCDSSSPAFRYVMEMLKK